jgi:hypothetical protein
VAERSPDERAPNVDTSFSSSVERHLAHWGVRPPVTSVSNRWPQSRQMNSKSGIPQEIQDFGTRYNELGHPSRGTRASPIPRGRHRGPGRQRWDGVASVEAARNASRALLPNTRKSPEGIVTASGVTQAGVQPVDDAPMAGAGSVAGRTSWAIWMHDRAGSSARPRLSRTTVCGSAAELPNRTDG